MNKVYPVIFPCEGEELLGLIHAGRPDCKRGVVIVVAGGPQYRAGAHRQFVSLAQRLADAGNSVLRFDLRGMGDSGGEHLGYEHSHADMAAGIDALLAHEPHLQEIVLFGECESASGILFYAYRDARVRGVALINPWVRTAEGQAQTYVKHYYLQRLLSPLFWKKVRKGEFHPLESLASFTGMLFKSIVGRIKAMRHRIDDSQEDIAHLPLPERTATGFSRFGGRILLMMSGRDYIAREFDEVTGSSAAWRGLLDNPKVVRHDVADADHTFSRTEWKQEAQDILVDWLDRW